jgi:hypothetical protein
MSTNIRECVPGARRGLEPFCRMLFSLGNFLPRNRNCDAVGTYTDQTADNQSDLAFGSSIKYSIPAGGIAHRFRCLLPLLRNVVRMLGRTELAAVRAPTTQCGYIRGTFHGPWFSNKALYCSAVAQLDSADGQRRRHFGDKRAKRA